MHEEYGMGEMVHLVAPYLETAAFKNQIRDLYFTNISGSLFDLYIVLDS